MAPYAHITGWGMAVPERVLTNADLERMVETSDEWIRTRTGIRERRIAAPEESTATLATRAALQALQRAHVSPQEVDLIIVSTSSPDHLFPATAALVQDAIGAMRAGAFDLLAACTGFIYALSMAANAIRSGSIRTALVIGAETLSRIVNWQDRNTCILFGDGAGAFVLQAAEQPGGLLAEVLHADGSGADLLTLPAGGSKLPASAETVAQGLHFVHMNGREVFRFATRVMAEAVEEVLAKAGLSKEAVTVIVPHQANRRILEAAARGLKLPLEKFVINLDRYGNTSTASIPIAVCEAVAEGRIRPGDTVVFVGFGAGLTYGAAVARWTGPLVPPDTRPLRLRRYLRWARWRSFWRRTMRRVLAWLLARRRD